MHVGVVVVHRVEDPRSLLAGHLAEEVGEVVVLHLVEHVDQPVEVEALDEVQLLGFRQLLEHVGEPLVVHRLGELPAPSTAAAHARSLATSAGWRSRSRAASAANSLAACEQGRHLVDVDEAVARAATEHVLRVASRTLAISHECPTVVPDGAQADVADGLVADLAVDDVAADQHLARLRLERVEVDVPAAQPGAVAGEAGDPVGVDEDPAALALGDEPDDAAGASRPGRPGTATMSWIRPIVAPPASSSGKPHHPEGVDEIAGHGRTLGVTRRTPPRLLGGCGPVSELDRPLTMRRPVRLCATST